MAITPRVGIVGGHGKVALLATPKLRQEGYDVDAIIRDPAQSDRILEAGATPIVLSLEEATVDALADAFNGATAIVFSAGAGGKGPKERTHNVDYKGALLCMEAAEEADVSRFVMVSYANALAHADKLDPSDSFYAYAKAKKDADAHLRKTELAYTILGPGALTLDDASRRLTRADAFGRVDGELPEGDARETSRENVAEAIVHVIKNNVAIRETVNFYDGHTPLEDIF